MTQEKWSSLTLVEQLGNVASEISRAQSWETRNDSAAKDKALERALELIDFTVAGQKNGVILREITRLREVVSDIFSGTNYYQTKLSYLNDYLMNFAWLAKNRL